MNLDRLILTTVLLGVTLATSPEAAPLEARDWMAARREAIVRRDLLVGVRLVIGHEAGAPVSAVCHVAEETRCQVVPSPRLEEALRAPPAPERDIEPGEARGSAIHDAALMRLRRIALEGAEWEAETRRPARVVAVATDLPIDDVVALAEQVLGGRSTTPADRKPAVLSLNQSSERLAVVSDEVTRPRVYTGWTFAEGSLEQGAALEVAFDLAVRHERSRLSTLLVGRGMARALRPFTLTEDGAEVPGFWLEPGERASVDRIRRFVDGTLKQLRIVGPTAREVARAKARLAVGSLHTWEDVARRARALGELERSAGDARRFLDRAEAVERVTPENVRAAVAAHLVDARRTTLEVYPPLFLPDDPRLQKHLLYTIVSGDTLTAIAKRFGATVTALAGANDLDPKRSLTPGDALWIPPR